jgi:hypothetical protein
MYRTSTPNCENGKTVDHVSKFTSNMKGIQRVACMAKYSIGGLSFLAILHFGFKESAGPRDSPNLGLLGDNFDFPPASSNQVLHL